MKYPKLNVLATSREQVDAFGGYNHNLRIGENEFYEMKNMTSDYYPVLSPRGGRKVHTDTTSANGMISKDNLCHVDGKRFYINGKQVSGLELSTSAESNPKTLVSMGAYVIILPDKKYINTENTSDYGSIEATTTNAESTGNLEVTVSLAKVDGTDYGDVPNSDTEPSNPQNGDLWVDTSVTPNKLKQYSSTSALMWVDVATTYVKIQCPGIGKGFSKHDGVTISGLKQDDLNGSFVVYGAESDYIIVTGIVKETFKQTQKVTISRKMPDMDFVVECGNRLWGCKYGYVDGKIVNELYASKLGDFKNWECYMGISTDSWRGSVGTDGVFTGAITHMGHPVFFKENCLHKVYISSAGAHQVQDTACRGVQRECAKSLSIVNEILYYKSRSGFMAYDGSLPVESSYSLGNEKYFNAVAGTLGNKYYVSVLDESGAAQLFVYDTAKSVWHKEDDLRIVEFCESRGELYGISSDRKKIYKMTGGDEIVKWSAQTGKIGLGSPDMKFMSRLTVRMELPIGTKLDIYVQYGFEKTWQKVFHTESTSLRSFSVPIRPKRCDFMRIRFEGVGDAKIYAYTKTMRNGSEIS